MTLETAVRLHDFSALTFDCYGTLIDWEQGLISALSPWLKRHGRAIHRDSILETYARVETELEAQHPGLLYPEILRRGMLALSQIWDLKATPEELSAFGASVPDWPAFADSPKALKYLQQHFKLVILSNVDQKSFAGSQSRLGIVFDAIYTAEDVGSYKPDPRNFDYLLEQLQKQGIEPSKILHTAQSLFHDHVPARAKGLATAWIDRRHDQQGWGATPAAEVQTDFRFAGMKAMADAHRAEARS